MRHPPYFRRFAAVALWSTAAICVQADDQAKSPGGPRFSAEAAVGVEYDSNVSVEEVDASSNQSDYAYLLEFGLQMRQELPADADLSLTYDLSQSIYDQFSILDRQTHILGADLSIDLGPASPGVSIYYINSRLDNRPFLELYRISPSVSGFLTRKWFARAGYVYSEKTLENRPARDADSHSAEIDAYYFHRGLRSYFNLGYRFKDETAGAARYDYSSNAVKLRYVYRFELGETLAKMELAWRFEDRDYSSVTPSIGEKRADERNQWKADLEIPFTSAAAIQFYYGYGDYDSNYAPVDYNQHIIATRFIYRW